MSNTSTNQTLPMMRWYHSWPDYDPGLLILAFLIAVQAAYVAVYILKSHHLKPMVVLGALCFSVGSIFCMHFVAMAAESNVVPMNMDTGWTIASVFFAFIPCALAMVFLATYLPHQLEHENTVIGNWNAFKEAPHLQLLFAAVLMSIGTAAMHWTATIGMYPVGVQHYDILWICICSAYLFVACVIALHCCFVLPLTKTFAFPTAVVLSVATTGFHCWAAVLSQYVEVTDALVQPEPDNMMRNVAPYIVFLSTVLSFIAWFVATHFTRNSNAPTDENQPATIIFTDIQNSTKLYAKIPYEMQEANEKHHKIMLSQLSRYGGFFCKSVGDSVMSAWKDPLDALAYMIDTQVLLNNSKWDPKINLMYKKIAMQAWRKQRRAAAGDGRSSQGGGTGTGSNTVNEHFSDIDGSPSNNETGSVKTDKSGNGSSDSTGITGGGIDLEQINSTATHFNGLRVRMGANHGSVSIVFDESNKTYDYFSNAVNCAARVEAASSGGQVLITRQLLNACGGEEAVKRRFNCEVESHGMYALRGMTENTELIEITPEQLILRRPFPPPNATPAAEAELEDSMDDDELLAKALGQAADEIAQNNDNINNHNNTINMNNSDNDFTNNNNNNMHNVSGGLLLDGLKKSTTTPISPRSPSTLSPHSLTSPNQQQHHRHSGTTTFPNKSTTNNNNNNNNNNQQQQQQDLAMSFQDPVFMNLVAGRSAVITNKEFILDTILSTPGQDELFENGAAEDLMAALQKTDDGGKQIAEAIKMRQQQQQQQQVKEETEHGSLGTGGEILPQGAHTTLAPEASAASANSGGNRHNQHHQSHNSNLLLQAPKPEVNTDSNNLNLLSGTADNIHKYNTSDGVGGGGGGGSGGTTDDHNTNTNQHEGSSGLPPLSHHQQHQTNNSYYSQQHQLLSHNTASGMQSPTLMTSGQAFGAMMGESASHSRSGGVAITGGGGAGGSNQSGEEDRQANNNNNNQGGGGGLISRKSGLRLIDKNEAAAYAKQRRNELSLGSSGRRLEYNSNSGGNNNNNNNNNNNPLVRQHTAIPGGANGLLIVPAQQQQQQQQNDQEPPSAVSVTAAAAAAIASNCQNNTNTTGDTREHESGPGIGDRPPGSVANTRPVHQSHQYARRSSQNDQQQQSSGTASTSYEGSRSQQQLNATPLPNPVSQLKQKQANISLPGQVEEQQHQQQQGAAATSTAATTAEFRADSRTQSNTEVEQVKSNNKKATEVFDSTADLHQKPGQPHPYNNSANNNNNNNTKLHSFASGNPAGFTSSAAVPENATADTERYASGGGVLNNSDNKNNNNNNNKSTFKHTDDQEKVTFTDSTIQEAGSKKKTDETNHNNKSSSQNQVQVLAFNASSSCSNPSIVQPGAMSTNAQSFFGTKGSVGYYDDYEQTNRQQQQQQQAGVPSAAVEQQQQHQKSQHHPFDDPSSRSVNNNNNNTAAAGLSVRLVEHLRQLQQNPSQNQPADPAQVFEFVASTVHRLVRRRFSKALVIQKLRAQLSSFEILLHNIKDVFIKREIVCEISRSWGHRNSFPTSTETIIRFFREFQGGYTSEQKEELEKEITCALTILSGRTLSRILQNERRESSKIIVNDEDVAPAARTSLRHSLQLGNLEGTHNNNNLDLIDPSSKNSRSHVSIEIGSMNQQHTTTNPNSSNSKRRASKYSKNSTRRGARNNNNSDSDSDGGGFSHKMVNASRNQAMKRV